MLEIFPLKAFKDNYIWVIRIGRSVVVVDPGDAAPVQEYLQQTGDALVAVLITHHHSDHVGGLGRLLAQPGNESVQAFGPGCENICGLSHALVGDELIRIPGTRVEFQVLAIPGHTKGHIGYYSQVLKPEGVLFCGDTLFGAGCGRLFEGTPEQMQKSLERLASLPETTLCYCAHEYTKANLCFAIEIEPENPSLLRRIDNINVARGRGEATVPFVLQGELETNPFMRWHTPAVLAAAQRKLGHQSRGPAETFAAIRKLKDEFRSNV